MFGNNSSSFGDFASLAAEGSSDFKFGKSSGMCVHGDTMV